LHRQRARPHPVRPVRSAALRAIAWLARRTRLRAPRPVVQQVRPAERTANAALPLRARRAVARTFAGPRAVARMSTAMEIPVGMCTSRVQGAATYAVRPSGKDAARPHNDAASARRLKRNAFRSSSSNHAALEL